MVLTMVLDVDDVFLVDQTAVEEKLLLFLVAAMDIYTRFIKSLIGK